MAYSLPGFLGDDYPVEKVRRSARLRWNAHYRQRDRARKSYRRQLWVGYWAWMRRLEPDYSFNRQPAPTALPFGKAYEKRKFD